MTKWETPPEAVWVWGKYGKYAETYCHAEEIKQEDFDVPVTKYVRADLYAALEAQLAEAREALAESDRQAEKLEALLDPYIAWEGKPAKAYVTSGVSGVGWIPLTEKNNVMTCPLPADETVVEVMLKDGTVCRALYSCNLMEAGDWDFVPVTDDDEPDDDADSIASEVVAWRHTFQPSRPSEQRELSAEDEATFDLAFLRSGRKVEATPSAPKVTEEMVEAASKAVVAEWKKMTAETSPHMSPGDHARAFVSPGNYRLIRAALKAAMEAGRHD